MRFIWLANIRLAKPAMRLWLMLFPYGEAMTGCRISRVKMKNGGADLTIFEPKPSQRVKYEYPWGSVTIEYSDGGELDRSTQVYMLESTKNKIMYDK